MGLLALQQYIRYQSEVKQERWNQHLRLRSAIMILSKIIRPEVAFNDQTDIGKGRMMIIKRTESRFFVV
uniref:NR LBD domain-containing protein n=1 Tax=Caenorhabditis tropicalis TaxID=1561998 RepID=A0A1I7TAY1_9PELO